MVQHPDPRQNRILAALPLDAYLHLGPFFEPIELKLGDSLAEPGTRMSYAYFPTDSIVSLVCGTGDGASTEISVVGTEGVVGVPLFMGGGIGTNSAIVTSAGSAYRIRGPLLKAEFFRMGPLHELLLRYTQALFTQIAQTALCNRYHSLDQQLCRWLLLSLDRLTTNELHMTQELIANMLGVRREGVTQSACKLQKAGLISYHRGRIAILDRHGLEARACECYGVINKEYDRLICYCPPRNKGIDPSTFLRATVQ